MKKVLFFITNGIDREGGDNILKTFTRKGIKYETDNGEVTVVGLRKKNITHLEIPNEVDGMPVKWICAHAFMNESFQTASLPAGIAKIPNATFYGCHALREIEFRGDIEEVQLMQCAIGYCNNLNTIKSKRPIRKVWGEISIQNCPNLSYIENLIV